MCVFIELFYYVNVFHVFLTDFLQYMYFKLLLKLKNLKKHIFKL